MTNNHLLNEKNINSNKSIKLYKANNKKDTIEIPINNEDFIFMSELIDVTFIELNDEIIEEIKPYFLLPSDKDAEINESISIFQYPNSKFSLNNGNITSIRSFNYYHNVSTDSGSIGSPLLNKEYKVVGIHKSELILKNEESVGVAIKYSEIKFAIGILYNNKNIYGIDSARRSAKLLSMDEMKILNEYGLELKLSSNEEGKYAKKFRLKELELLKNSLFKCTFSKRLLFYRTNYAWYVTMTSKKRNNYIIKYNLDNIELLDWTHISLNNTELIEKIDKNLKEKNRIGREHILITWLGLTEQTYL